MRNGMFVVVGCLVAAMAMTGCTAENPLASLTGEGIEGGVENRFDGDAGEVLLDMVGVDAMVDTAPDMVMVADLVDVPDLAPDCSLARNSCRDHLQAGCDKDGEYTVSVKNLGEMKVWCEMQDDGGGWALVYSNANNWASEKASTIESVQVNGNAIGKWYDSKWYLRDEASPNRLGRAWDGTGPLTPDVVGGNDPSAFYANGSTDVRFEFVQGADGKQVDGWCATNNWDWTSSNRKTFRCKNNIGSICLSGGTPCDGHDGNSGWISSLALGNDVWDYAYQSAPNHLFLGLGCDGVGYPCTVNGFVTLWNQQMNNGNAGGKNYQIRIWLREPK